MTYTLNNIINSPLKNKTKAKVTSDFGKRTMYNNVTKKYETNHHNGIDIIGGNEIVSFFDGVVTSTRNNIKGYSSKYPSGNYVTIKHSECLYSTYCHLKYQSVNVKKNEIVSSNTILGLMGKTGHATGTHLHFGIKKNGKWIDPKPFLLNNTMETNNKKEITYIVKKGDNLSKIAKKYNTTWQSIYQKNKELIGNNPNLIKIGWKLKI